MKKRVTFDFETRSACDLKKAGAYKYSLDPTTRPTCLAFKIHGKKGVYFLDFEMVGRKWENLPSDLKIMWSEFINEGYEFSGHNAFFETCIYKNILRDRLGWPDIPFKLFRCTAAKAASCALPRNLADAGASINLAIQKDKRGYNAMMATCKPTKKYNAWKKAVEDMGAGKHLKAKRQELAMSPAPKMFLDPSDSPEIWNTLYTYCKIDVKAEEQLDEALPDLIPSELEIWFLNQKLNWRGLRIDIPTVSKIVDIMQIENKSKLKELDTLTMGLVTKPGARASILEFLALDGIELPDIKAKTVSDALEGFKLTDDARRLLEIRKALSMTSTKKYQGFLNRANTDDRVRDILLYHGASTGRDTGSGIQPHNFPRGLIKVDKNRPYAAVEKIIECDKEMLNLLYGPSLAILFSAVLRNMIVPTAGRELFVADFSKIEVAVLWWLADNKPGLKILNDGLDPYKYMAAENTGMHYKMIGDDSDDRQLGKAQVLGCGFGMGGVKFQDTAWVQYRLKLTLEQSKRAVANYREANEAVPALWDEYEQAAINAVENSGIVISAGLCRFYVENRFLWIELPSGRRLAYRDPSIIWRVREYEVVEEISDEHGNLIRTSQTVQSRPQKTLEFWAVNSKTKKWNGERTWGGTLTENIVQATARDLMMPAMVRLEKKNYQALLMVHDEGICEKDIGKGSIEEFVEILCERPDWAVGLPLEAKGWNGPRYRK